MAREKTPICLVAASPVTVTSFLLKPIEALVRTYDVTVVADDEDGCLADRLRSIATVERVAIRRKPDPAADLRALLKLMVLFGRRRFAVVHTVTPKAGLLGMMAAAAVRVPERVHTFTGQVWATSTGSTRQLLKVADRTIAKCATRLLADGWSQRDFLVREGIVGSGKCSVILDGSFAGVDLDRFAPDPIARESLKAQLGLTPEERVVLFLGRFTRDKGIVDLCRAFALIAARRPEAHLVLVGQDEEGLVPRLKDLLSEESGRLHVVGPTTHPEAMLAGADILALPSYREGFSNVVLEAAATGVPAVVSRIYGTADAVVDGVTGMFHEPGDVDGIAARIEQLLADDDLRGKQGEAARNRAATVFSSERVVRGWVDNYARMTG